MQIKTKLKSYNSPTFLAYALIAPAAIIPVPDGAALNKTLPAPLFDNMS